MEITPVILCLVFHNIYTKNHVIKWLVMISALILTLTSCYFKSADFSTDSYIKSPELHCLTYLLLYWITCIIVDGRLSVGLLNIAYVVHGIYLCYQLIFFRTQQSASMEPTVSEATYDTIVAQGTELATLNKGRRVKNMNLGYLIYPRDEHVVNGKVEPRLFPIH